MTTAMLGQFGQPAYRSWNHRRASTDFVCEFSESCQKERRDLWIACDRHGLRPEVTHHPELVVLSMFLTNLQTCSKREEKGNESAPDCLLSVSADYQVYLMSVTGE